MGCRPRRQQASGLQKIMPVGCERSCTTSGSSGTPDEPRSGCLHFLAQLIYLLHLQVILDMVHLHLESTLLCLHLWWRLHLLCLCWEVTALPTPWPRRRFLPHMSSRNLQMHLAVCSLCPITSTTPIRLHPKMRSLPSRFQGRGCRLPIWIRPQRSKYCMANTCCDQRRTPGITRKRACIAHYVPWSDKALHCSLPGWNTARSAWLL